MKRRRKRQGLGLRKPLSASLSVVVASPMMDLCHSIFCSSLVHLTAHTIANGDGIEFGFMQYGTSILPLSRMKLAQRVVDTSATHILWIDSDMEFPPDMLLRLAEHRQPIVAANCMARRPPHALTARDADGNEVYTLPESEGIEKVSRIGFGVVWMSTDVLRKIDKPWFNYEWLPEKNVFKGEDFYFSERAAEAGYDLYIDHDLSKQVLHYGSTGYSPLFKSDPEGGA